MFMQNAETFRPAEMIVPASAGFRLRPDLAGPGILAGGQVETDAGWVPVECLVRGMRVATYDGGFCPLVRAERLHLWPAPGAAAIHVPGGALDNCDALTVLAGQPMLIASDLAEAVLDSAAVLVPAAALVGYRGIARTPLDRPRIAVSLGFARDEAVYVNSGALAFCPAETRTGAPAFFPTLGPVQARAMLDLIEAGARSTADLAPAA